MTETQIWHLSDIGFKRIAPSPLLRPFVQWFWYIRSTGHLRMPRREFMHPDGNLGLVFNWGDELMLSDGRYPQSVVFDEMRPHSRQLQLAGYVEAFGVLFRPGGAFSVFGLPVPELSGIDVYIDQHPSDDLPHLHEQLAEIPTFEGKVAHVEKWLKSRLRHATPLSPVIAPSLSLFNRSEGQVSIHDVATAVYMSQRQLERLYKEQVGLSPKKVARLFRVRQARLALKQRYDQPLAMIAQTAGFYDQAHFTREFQAVVGLTPGAYLARLQNR